MPLPPKSLLISICPRPENSSAIASLSIWSLDSPLARRPCCWNARKAPMPILLKGSCRCQAVRFEVESHTPVPYQLCYCSICRKQQGGGGFAINLGADSATLKITGKRHLGLYRAEIEDDEHPHCETSTGERRFCRKCGSAL